MAKADYFQKGENLDYVNSGSDVIGAGDIILIGKRLGVAACDIATGAVGSVAVSGVFKLPKAAEALTMGTPVYWDATNSCVTATSTSNTLCGFCTADAAEGDATVPVKLNA